MGERGWVRCGMGIQGDEDAGERGRRGRRRRGYEGQFSARRNTEPFREVEGVAELRWGGGGGGGGVAVFSRCGGDDALCWGGGV